ncbi:MAG TPA: AAA family ATPase [bacterium]|nr:AAA family ATPase [bacterium]
MDMITNIEVKGFKSFRDVSIPLGPINVLIGANGSGKSNLISLFRMLGYMLQGRFQEHISVRGGAGSFLHYGRKITKDVFLSLDFEGGMGRGKYLAHWRAADPDRLIFKEEEWHIRGEEVSGSGTARVGRGALNETRLYSRDGELSPDKETVRNFLSRCRVYQFHDTSPEANIRQGHYIGNNLYLYGHAGNLAAYLYMLKKSKLHVYNLILDIIRLAAPFFGDFELEPEKLNSDNIMLKWREAENEYLFGPHQLPDGLLRFMALVALFTQSDEDLPKVIIIDEPELGLHPAALNLLAAMVREASHSCQVIIATQSVGLVENFEPKDIIVMERQRVAGRTEFETIIKPVGKENLTDWLDEYSIGELWLKNVIGGRP